MKSIKIWMIVVITFDFWNCFWNKSIFELVIVEYFIFIIINIWVLSYLKSNYFPESLCKMKIVVSIYIL